MKRVISFRKILCMLTILLVVILWGCKFYFAKTSDTITITPEQDQLARGKNLTYTICAGCHFDSKTGRFSGHYLNDLPRIAGRLYSSNITHSALYGLSPQYTDGELFYLFKTGISRSGKFMPYMMKPMMADDDVKAIIAFLHSDDPGLAAEDADPGHTKINLIGRTGIRFLMGPQPYTKNVQRPNEADPIEYGRYLVAVIGCYHCHSKKTTGLDFHNAENTKGYLLGGIKLKDPQGNRIYATNLTPDSSSGIGYFTKEEFRNAVRDGISPSGHTLSPPMDKFDHLTDKQVDAIYAYLRSIPAVYHKVRKV